MTPTATFVVVVVVPVLVVVLVVVLVLVVEIVTFCLTSAGPDADDEMVNGDVSMTTTDADRVRRQDIIAISGKQEDCEAASNALQVSSNSYGCRRLNHV